MTASDEMKEMFEFETIQAAPVYLLEECFAAAENHSREDISEDMEDGTNPIEKIKEHFHSALYLCNERELAFLALAATISEKMSAWMEAVNYYPYNVFACSDFTYLFLWNKQYYLVLPNELLTIYKETISEPSFAEVNAKKQEMTDYANALLNLYGAYEFEWFMTVWNQHHKDKITSEEAEEFLVDRAYFHSDFYFYDWFVVHDCMDEDEFDNLWDQTEKFEYYMPPKSVIREYASKGCDDSKIPGELEMEGFLAEHIQDQLILECLQFEVKESCERLKTPAEVMQILSDASAPLGEKAFCERFERLYNNLRDNTHIWELRGFTPYQYQVKTNQNIPRFELPKGKKRRNK